MTNVQVASEGEVLTIRVDMTEVAQELTRQVEQWRQTAEKTRKHWEESEWYLGEARDSIARLEEQLGSLREVYGQLEARHRETTEQLQEAERERNDVNWDLGELRAEHEALRQEAQELTEQLAEARRDVEVRRGVAEDRQDRLEVEQLHHTVVDAKLEAVRTNGERRRAVRVYRPDVTVEIQRLDGTVLFRGVPHNVSLTGFGFASHQGLDDVQDRLDIRLHISGVERPLEAVGRLAWYEPSVMSTSYLGGCEFFDMPAIAAKPWSKFLRTQPSCNAT